MDEDAEEKRALSEQDPQEKPLLLVHTLGRFSVRCRTNEIGESVARASKPWLLISYLFCNCRRQVQREELVEMLSAGSPTPMMASSFRAVLSRARSYLATLQVFPDGSELLYSKSGVCSWNPDVEIRLDVESLESLCSGPASKETPEETLERLRQISTLYQGDFLARFREEVWVEQAAEYYNSLMTSAILYGVQRLRECGLGRSVVPLCRSALRFAPFHEELQRELMLCLYTSGDAHGAAEAYELFRKNLQADLDIAPDEETQKLYQEILLHMEDKPVTIAQVLAQLREAGPTHGALLCDYDRFLMYYRAEARASARRGDAVHIALLTLAGRGGKRLTGKIVSHAIGVLKESLQACLRAGDVAAPYGATQYLVMLIQANYENSERVCQRIAEEFQRRAPRSSAMLQAAVMPLEPAF